MANSIPPFDGSLAYVDQLHQQGKAANDLTQLQGIIDKLTEYAKQNSDRIAPITREGIDARINGLQARTTRLQNQQEPHTQPTAPAPIVSHSPPLATTSPKTSRLIDRLFGGTISPTPSAQSQNASATHSMPVVGFHNAGQNCWCNALLQMIINTPSLKEAYTFLALHLIHDQKDTSNPPHGHSLINALNAYEQAAQSETAIDSSVSQQVRVALHHFNPQISDLAKDAEDASEALNALMGRYEAACKEAGQPLHPLLYKEITLTRSYIPEGVPEELEESRKDKYTPMDASSSIKTSTQDWQLMLNLPKQPLPFPVVLSDAICRQTQGEDCLSKYKSSDEKLLQSYQLAEESIRFENAPEELVVTLKRFLHVFSNGRYHAEKIDYPVGIARILTLPKEANPNRSDIQYELDSFILHQGGTKGGHYISYRQIEGKWYECNDSRITEVSAKDIDRIVQNGYIYHYRQGNLLAPSDITISAIQTEENSYTQRILALKNLMPLLRNPQTSKEALNECIDSLPKDIKNLLHFTVWLEDKMPDVWNYGSKTLSNNPRKLAEMKTAWFVSGKENIVAQLLELEKQKLQKIEKQKILADVDLLNVSANEDLRKIIKNLPVTVQNTLRGLTYEFHKATKGESVVNAPQYCNDYGKIILTQRPAEIFKELRDIGRNVSEELKQKCGLDTRNKVAEKMQLEALLGLMRFNTISDLQIQKIFPSLDLSESLKKTLSCMEKENPRQHIALLERTINEL